MQYETYIPLLIEAMKEQQETIEELREKLYATFSAATGEKENEPN